jgi:hypothetical protein
LWAALLFVVVAVVDDEAAKIGDGFEQLLESVVPFGGGLKEEHDALVGESQLEVAGLADVVDEVLGVFDLLGLIVGVGLVAELFEQDGDVGFCSTKSFQPSGLSSSKRTVGTSSAT